MKLKKIGIKYKKIFILIISIIIVMIIKPPIKHYKVNEKFYQENGIEYNIVQCPECGRDVADVQQFCLNCGAVLFDADEQTLEFLEQVHENLKPTKLEQIMSISKKIVTYIIIIAIVYYLIIKLLSALKRIKHKIKS